MIFNREPEASASTADRTFTVYCATGATRTNVDLVIVSGCVPAGGRPKGSIPGGLRVRRPWWMKR